MIVDDIVVIFADGTRYRFAGTSATEVVLSRVFLKFFLICMLIFAFLHQRVDLINLEPWDRIATHLALAIAALTWLLFSIGCTILLRKWGVIRSVYTPFISVTTILVSEFALQFMRLVVLKVSPDISAVPLQYVIQPMVVIFLMDMLFGNFVAVQHPSFEGTDLSSPPTNALPLTRSTSVAEDPGAPVPVSKTEDPRPAEQLEVAVPGPETLGSDQAPHENSVLSLNGKEIPIHEILVMSIEDHYLRIETTETSFLLRYKISAAVNKIDPELGVQVNRSVWVARSAIQAVYRTPSYGAEVALTNGVEYTVSRSRIAGVLDCLKRWDIEVERRD